MEAPEDYIAQVDKAVTQIINSLKYYDQLLDDGIIISPFFAENEESKPNEKYLEWYKENEDRIKNSQNKLEEFGGLYYSRQILSGALLQIVDRGIVLFRNEVDTSKIPDWVKKALDGKLNSIIPFFHGKIIWNLPQGLIVHAARNQFNHFDEEAINSKSTRVVLNHIAEQDASINADLYSREKGIIAHRVIKKFGWHHRRFFDQDFKELLRI